MTALINAIIKISIDVSATLFSHLKNNMFFLYVVRYNLRSKQIEITHFSY